MTRIAGEQPTNPINILRFLAKHPRFAPVIAAKIWKRIAGRSRCDDGSEIREWMGAYSLDAASIADSLAPDLWSEALEFGRKFRSRAASILADVPFDMGAGGDYEFLYWLTRYLRPKYVVETGVSAGWSTEAFLAAMSVNNAGTLCSSDFPYFRVRNPEAYIGILVSPELKSRWHLSIKGDQTGIPELLSKIPQVDLFHYDSDKSYAGRDLAVSFIEPKLAPEGLMIIDDISDNDWFRKKVEQDNVPFAVLARRAGLIDPSRRLLKQDEG